MINQTNQISTRSKKNHSLPEEWHVFQFSQLAIRRRESFDPKTRGQNFQCIELEHLDQGTGKIIGSINSISQQSNKSVFKIGDVLFGKLRPYLRKFALVDFNGVCSSEIWVLINKSPIIPEYLFLLVQTEKFLSFANRTSGTKMPRADWDLVKRIDFPIPTKKEQQKISSIINKWDQAINLVEKQIKAKRKLKKALMQQLFTSRLRFPGFSKIWDKVSLNRIFFRIKRKTKNPSLKVLSITSGVGFLGQEEKFGRVIAGKTIKNYTWLRNGEFAYNKGNSKTFPQGCIYRLEEFEEGLVPNVFLSFNPKSDQVYGDFL